MNRIYHHGVKKNRIQKSILDYDDDDVDEGALESLSSSAFFFGRNHFSLQSIFHSHIHLGSVVGIEEFDKQKWHVSNRKRIIHPSIHPINKKNSANQVVET